MEHSVGLFLLLFALGIAGLWWMIVWLFSQFPAAKNARY
jgi:hypothetical protein